MATNHALERFIQKTWDNKQIIRSDELVKHVELYDVTRALQIINLPISSLEVYVRRCETTFPSKRQLDNLTFDEYAAAYMCTMEMGTKSLFVLLNQVLSSEDQKKAVSWAPFLRLIYSAAKKLPIYHGECWRYADVSIMHKLKKELFVTWNGISSCAQQPEFLIQNVPCRSKVLFKISTNNGRNFSKYTAPPESKEILLMPNTRFTIKEWEIHRKYGNMTVVHLQEVTDTQDAPVTHSVPISRDQQQPQKFSKYSVFFSNRIFKEMSPTGRYLITSIKIIFFREQRSKKL